MLEERDLILENELEVDVSRAVNRVLDTAPFDVIGWDSCVLAANLLCHELEQLGIVAQACGCSCDLYSEKRNVEVRILDHERKQLGHVVVIADGRYLIDITLPQVNDIDGWEDEIPPVVMRLPADIREQKDKYFEAVGSVNADIKMTYRVQINGEQYFADSIDWNQPVKLLKELCEAVKESPDVYKQFIAAMKHKNDSSDPS